jgi:hypothetical protein
MATPQQRFTAKNVRGYRFAMGPAGARAVNMDPREVFVLGTVGPEAAAPPPDPTPAAAPPDAANEVEPPPSIDDWARAHPTTGLVIAPSSGPAPIASAPAPPAGVPVAREGTATRCPFCLADDFESVPSLKCPSCKAWQHHACVTEHKKCAACNMAWPA